MEEREEHKELQDLIERYGLDEDIEHIIIPLWGKDGGSARCFLLKRKYFRIAYPDGHTAVFPIGEVIEAIMQYPDLPLRESLPHVHVEPDEPEKPEKEIETMVDIVKEGDTD
ncbi:MAG: hypothetical protein WA610_09815 [Thermodesulfovibrionales bacterium]